MIVGSVDGNRIWGKEIKNITLTGDPNIRRIGGGGTRNPFLNWKIFASVDDDVSHY